MGICTYSPEIFNVGDAFDEKFVLLQDKCTLPINLHALGARSDNRYIINIVETINNC